MLNKLRNFSKGKIATVLVAIIIVPFVFWGMGSVFSGGNTNSVAKLNNHNISTKDFVEFINKSKINPELIRDNIDNNILEQLLKQLVSTTLIDVEIEDLNLKISDNILANKIKNQKTFKDDNNEFSRVKYEKFLLENNLSVSDFEQNIKKGELKNKLFKYIGGGIKSPYFLTNKNYRNQTKKIDVQYFDLNNIFKKKEDFTKTELENYLTQNEEKFKREIIDISYTKIIPETLTDQKVFNESFFSKIDEIENLILNDNNFDTIIKNYSLKPNIIIEYDGSLNAIDEANKLIYEIYLKRNQDKIQIIDKNDFFLLYEIKNTKSILPSKNDESFIEEVKNDFFENQKKETLKELISKIENNKFTNNDFLKLTDGYKINKINITSIKDDIKFNSESINILYSLPKNAFSLIVDNNDNIFIAKIENFEEKNLDKTNVKLSNYLKESNKKLRDNLYISYDFMLNEKYKININKKSLDRIKNYFR
jgi:peptidyl-prolyl cis-trans isomerase D